MTTSSPSTARRTGRRHSPPRPARPRPAARPAPAARRGGRPTARPRAPRPGPPARRRRAPAARPHGGVEAERPLVQVPGRLLAAASPSRWPPRGTTPPRGPPARTAPPAPRASRAARWPRCGAGRASRPTSPASASRWLGHPAPWRVRHHRHRALEPADGRPARRPQLGHRVAQPGVRRQQRRHPRHQHHPRRAHASPRIARAGGRRPAIEDTMSTTCRVSTTSCTR